MILTPGPSDPTSKIDTSVGVVTYTPVVPLFQPPSMSSSSPNFGVIILGILLPVPVILGAIIAFLSWRKRQQRHRRGFWRADASGVPTPYELDADARSATAVVASTKLRQLFGAGGKENTLPESLIGNANGGDDPLVRSTSPDGFTVTLVTPKQPPRHTSAQTANRVRPQFVTPQLIVGGPALQQPRLEPEMRELRELRELHQAMNNAGFTVNTLFDRLRRNNSTRRHGETVVDLSTVTSQSAVGEPLPRYE